MEPVQKKAPLKTLSNGMLCEGFFSVFILLDVATREEISDSSGLGLFRPIVSRGTPLTKCEVKKMTSQVLNEMHCVIEKETL